MIAVVFSGRVVYLSTDSHGDFMSDVKTAIMDAAERRVQQGGFGGFSFREIAADVGIKSSSVHYHFPTKEDLAAAVVRRWAEYTSELIDKELEKDPDPIRVWTKAFRGTAFSEAHMCPCTVLAAASQSLPEQVAKEVKGFFKMCQDKLVAEGLSPSNAAEVLSTITGALVLANAFGDTAEYDRATRELLRHRATAPADRHGPRGPRTKRLVKGS
jgi:TetR/AcrR family transcriptional regulator, transcriptional repressor for nem operon